MDEDHSTEVTVFHTDFSKAFDKVAHYTLIQKGKIFGVDGSLFEILINYLENRKQFVRVDNTRPKTFDITGGEPQ